MSCFFWPLCCLVLRFTDSDYPFGIFKLFLTQFFSLFNWMQKQRGIKFHLIFIHNKCWQQSHLSTLPIMFFLPVILLYFDDIHKMSIFFLYWAACSISSCFRLLCTRSKLSFHCTKLCCIICQCCRPNCRWIEEWMTTFFCIWSIFTLTDLVRNTVKEIKKHLKVVETCNL